MKNEFGQRNEVWVDWHRSWSGAQMLQRFQAVTGERLQVLCATRPEAFEAQTQTPIGPDTVRDLLHIRIFDAWVHELRPPSKHLWITFGCSNGLGPIYTATYPGDTG